MKYLTARDRGRQYGLNNVKCLSADAVAMPTIFVTCHYTPAADMATVHSTLQNHDNDMLVLCMVLTDDRRSCVCVWSVCTVRRTVDITTQ